MISVYLNSAEFLLQALSFAVVTSTLPVNISVKARARIIKLYEFFNMLRLRRITVQTNPLPKSAKEAITPNVTLRVVREWSILVLTSTMFVSFVGNAMTCQHSLSNRCFLRRKIPCIINDERGG